MFALQIVMPVIAIIASIITMVISIKKGEKLVVLKDISIIFLALTLIISLIGK